MESVFDQYIAILNDPNHPKHADLTRIMNTDYGEDDLFNQEMWLQINIRRRIKEVEEEKRRLEAKIRTKAIEDNRKATFEKLSTLDLDNDASEIELLVYELIDEFLESRNNHDVDIYMVRFMFYIKFIGWSITSRSNVDQLFGLVSEHLKMYPNARFIDWGCGTGIWSFLLKQKGIPKENIVAVDNYETDSYKRRYFPIIDKVDNFTPDDILFVAWGRTDEFIREFIEGGGKLVLILGENNGCTLSTDYFEELNGWTTRDMVFDGGARKHDYLSINQKLQVQDI